MKKPSLPKGWQWLKLRELGTLTGGGTPSRKVSKYYTGTIPWVTIKDLKEGVFEISDAQEHITEEAIRKSATNLIEPGAVIIATRVGLGKVAVNTAPVAINQDLKAFQPGRSISPNYIALLIHKMTFDILKYSQGTTVKGIRQDDLLNMNVPIPLLPVQERIVSILQKADIIRRKRQEALKIGNKILVAAFIEMFGNPASNPKDFPTRKLRDLCIAISGGTPSKKDKALWDEGTIPWVSPADMKVPEISDVPDKITEEAMGNRAKAQPGDVLIVVRGMILQHSAPIALVKRPLAFNQDIKALRPRGDIPGEFLYWMLQASKERLLNLVDSASHGTKKIDTDLLLDLSVIEPSSHAMQQFASIHRHFFETQNKRLRATTEAHSTFNALLVHAFTGELTAQWEADYADLISEQQSLYERLPQLLLLAFLQEKGVRANKNVADAALFVTALMKYVFLFQMEATTRRRLYHFIPYHYGPFAKELYSDLNALREQGFITINNGDDVRTRIALTDSGEVEAALLGLPADIKEDVTTIIETYGDLNHSELLDVVYEKYPIYAQKSRLKAKASIKK